MTLRSLGRIELTKRGTFMQAKGGSPQPPGSTHKRILRFGKRATPLANSRADWVLGSEPAEVADSTAYCTQRLLFNRNWQHDSDVCRETLENKHT